MWGRVETALRVVRAHLCWYHPKTGCGGGGGGFGLSDLSLYSHAFSLDYQLQSIQSSGEVLYTESTHPRVILNALSEEKYSAVCE